MGFKLIQESEHKGFKGLKKGIKKRKEDFEGSKVGAEKRRRGSLSMRTRQLSRGRARYPTKCYAYLRSAFLVSTSEATCTHLCRGHVSYVPRFVSALAIKLTVARAFLWHLKVARPLLDPKLLSSQIHRFYSTVSDSLCLFDQEALLQYDSSP